MNEKQCRRCGTCCAKGGPALHQADRELVDSGQIPLKCLFTIRQGEPAYDNIRRSIAPAATDIIKVKGAAEGDATCIFLDQERVGCGIYESRPVECRVLTCWDTRAITAMYDRERLTRADLLSRLPGLNDLVAEHQERCGYEQVAQWAERIKQGQDAEPAVEALLHAIRYDQSLRQVAVERTHLDPGLLEFLFGRPLSATIRMCGIKLAKTGGQVTIVASP
jgi:Fe-S-cluster containining protein